MQYLVTSRKAVTLDGVLRVPGDLITNPSNAAQLIRRGLAVPFGNTSTEQAETSSPSSEPAQIPSKKRKATEEETTSAEETSGSEDSSVSTAANVDDGPEVTPEPVAIEEGSEPPTGPSAAVKKGKA